MTVLIFLRPFRRKCCLVILVVERPLDALNGWTHNTQPDCIVASSFHVFTAHGLFVLTWLVSSKADAMRMCVWFQLEATLCNGLYIICQLLLFFLFSKSFFHPFFFHPATHHPHSNPYLPPHSFIIHVSFHTCSGPSSLSEESQADDSDDAQLYQSWFKLVLEKNRLVRYESELMIL